MTRRTRMTVQLDDQNNFLNGQKDERDQRIKKAYIKYIYIIHSTYKVDKIMSKGVQMFYFCL